MDTKECPATAANTFNGIKQNACQDGSFIRSDTFSNHSEEAIQHFGCWHYDNILSGSNVCVMDDVGEEVETSSHWFGSLYSVLHLRLLCCFLCVLLFLPRLMLDVVCPGVVPGCFGLFVLLMYSQLSLYHIFKKNSDKRFLSQPKNRFFFLTSMFYQRSTNKIHIIWQSYQHSQ